MEVEPKNKLTFLSYLGLRQLYWASLALENFDKKTFVIL